MTTDGSKLRIDVITLFPPMILEACSYGVIGRAMRSGLLTIAAHQLRDYTGGSHHPIDDHPYGGGPGMVMRPEPIHDAVEEVSTRYRPARKILLTPQGRPFSQAVARALARSGSFLLFCGRYEGVDERVRPLFDEELSIGDFVLSGGESAAVVLIDAVGRLVPGVLGCSQSCESESFADGQLEYPQFTRPESFRGQRVPAVLLSGNHAEIARWRKEQARERTRTRRPDLLRPETTDPDGDGG